MVKKTFKKSIKRSLKLSGGYNVWKDLLNLSIMPSVNLKKGGKTEGGNKLYKPFGKVNADKIMTGGNIRSGSTQYFPVNCTNTENNYPIKQTNQEGGKSTVWNDLVKMSVVPSIKKTGGNKSFKKK